MDRISYHLSYLQAKRVLASWLSGRSALVLRDVCSELGLGLDELRSFLLGAEVDLRWDQFGVVMGRFGMDRMQVIFRYSDFEFSCDGAVDFRRVLFSALHIFGFLDNLESVWFDEICGLLDCSVANWRDFEKLELSYEVLWDLLSFFDIELEIY